MNLQSIQVLEDDCVPIVESISGLKLNHDFFISYSPRELIQVIAIKVSQILKLLPVQTKKFRFIDRLYKSIIVAGTHKAASIKILKKRLLKMSKET